MDHTSGHLSNDEVHALKSRIGLFTGIAWACVILGILAGGLGLMRLYTGAWCISKYSWDDLSDFGSYFQGVVASIWSLAGLLFIYVAFLGQKQQLLRQEMDIAEQQKQFTTQHSSLERQGFESAFYQLLNLHNEITNQLQYGKLEARPCFSAWANEIRTLVGNVPAATDLEDERARVAGVYASYYYDKQEYFGHYFRTLYHVLKVVKTSSIKDKKQYTSLVRAQLSAAELVLLFYNCVSVYGDKLRPMVVEFALLEHLEKKLLVYPRHVQLYDVAAYG